MVGEPQIEDKFKVGLYARVSTEDRDQNPENQLFKMREFCKGAGWEIVKDGITNNNKEYIDYESGKEVEVTKRKQFLMLFDYKEQAQWDGIVVLREDRWSRDNADGWVYLRKLVKADKFLFILDKSLMINKKTINTPNVTAIFGISMVVAQIERQLASARVKEAFVRKKADAELKKEKIRWGKKKNLAKGLSGKFNKEIKPEEVIKLSGQGYSIRDIARQLGCSKSMIADILKNR